MINNILAKLPFNPGLITDISFYARRLKKEESVRRLGLVIIVLSMLLQLVIAMSPPERSLAYSDMNLINGLKTRDDLVAAWQNPGGDIDDIYGSFGVTLEDIKNLSKRPDTTIRSNGDNYWSVGRLSITGFSNIKESYKKSEVAVDVGPTTVYMRALRAWDNRNSYNTYKAWKGLKKSDGKPFWIVVDCGNYVQIDKVKTDEEPELQIRKTIPGNLKSIKPGENLKFRIEYRNKAPNSLAQNVVLEDELDLASLSLVSPKNLEVRGNIVRYAVGDLAYSKSFRVLDITVQLKPDLATGKKICNSALLSAANAKTAQSGKTPGICFEVGGSVTVPPPQEGDDEVVVGRSKTVRNLTGNLGDDALKTPLRPDQLVEFELLTTNTSSSSVLDHVIEDYVGDLLDYAELDLAYLTTQGGAYNSTSKKVVWANQTLKPGSDTVKTFRIKMKNPLPSTNSPSAATTTFDCRISNEYGNELSLEVACPLVKTLERLPNTGPGTTIAVGFTITAGAAYFFARSRLLAKELGIVKREYAAGRQW